MDFNIPYLFISFKKNRTNNVKISTELKSDNSGFDIC